MRTATVLLALLFLASAPCSADYGVADTSKERAKELGISVTATPSAGRDPRVHVEFEAAGRMKGFNWADLELTRNGKRLLTTALLPRKPAVLRVLPTTADTLQFEFYIDPAALPEASVTIFVRDEPLGGTGYRLKMKDFVPRTKP